MKRLLKLSEMAITNNFKAVPHKGKYLISKRGMFYDNVFDTKEQAEDFIRNISVPLVFNNKTKRYERK